MPLIIRRPSRWPVPLGRLSAPTQTRFAFLIAGPVAALANCLHQPNADLLAG